MRLIKLEWDSNVFGYPVGALNLDNEPFNEKQLIETTRGLRLVYVTSPSPIDSSLLCCGDAKVVFEKEPANYPVEPEVVEAPMSTLLRMKEIGLQSGLWSRFSLDPNFEKNEFEQLYGIWVERSMKKEIAYATMTVMTEGRPSGIVTLTKDAAAASSIGLFAVSDQFRGQGIGGKLLRAADRISHAKGNLELKVATQGKNKGACAVYEHFGFKRLRETYIYNYWNEAFTVQ